MTSFVTLGPSGIDHYYQAAQWPLLGDKAMLSGHEIRYGGFIANTSATLGALGAGVVHLERIGAAEADAVRQSLDSFGVDTGLIQVSDTARTCHTHVIRVGAERTILIDDAGREQLEVTDPVRNALTSANVIVTSLHELRQPAIREAVFSALTSGEPELALDVELAGLTDPELDVKSMLFASVLLVNVAAAGHLGVDIRALAGDPAEPDEPWRDVIVTDGARGVTIIGPATDIHVPAVATTPVDTTGASDAFLAAYLVARTGGSDALGATRFALDVAAEQVSGVGPRYAAEQLLSGAREFAPH